MIGASIRRVAGFFARLLPAGAPEYIYEKILRGPLQSVFNAFILSILPEVVQVPEGTIVLNRKDPIVSGLLTFGMYEPYETELFRGAIQPGMTIVDIGANIGYFTVIGSVRTGTTGRVIAFEPELENRTVLEQTVARNELSNVSVYPLAVADTKGMLQLNLFDSNKGKHSLVKDAADDRGFTKRIEVETTDLDSFLTEKNVQKADIIKMDIEGAESLALRGMQQTLEGCDILFMEYTPTSIQKVGHDPQAVLFELESAGFVVYAIHEHTRTLERVTDYAAFIKTIPMAHAANLFCRKK